MSATRARRVVVAAVGSEFRRDDAAGPAVLERVGPELAGVEVLGAFASPLDLLGAWDGADLAIVVDAVDAVDASDEPGAVRVVEMDTTFPPEPHGPTAPKTSSHGIGVIEALCIALTLGTAPVRVVLVGVAGEDFGEGIGLSPSASRAVERAVRAVGELAGVADVRTP